jgi:hypothetical protein
MRDARLHGPGRGNDRCRPNFPRSRLIRAAVLDNPLRYNAAGAMTEAGTIPNRAVSGSRLVRQPHFISIPILKAALVHLREDLAFGLAPVIEGAPAIETELAGKLIRSTCNALLEVKQDIIRGCGTAIELGGHGVLGNANPNPAATKRVSGNF